MTEELSVIQKAIRNKGYNWTAGKTSLSEVGEEQLKKKLGLKISEEEIEATTKAIEAQTRLMAFRAPFAVPLAIDWRNNSGDWTTAVKDQGYCGSCVAHAVCGAVESRIKIVCKNKDLNKDLSEAELFFCGCGNCCVPGWSFDSALNFTKNTGVCEEASFPYTDHDQPCKAGLTPYIKLVGWTKLLTIPDRKNILATKGPIVGGMKVYEDFQRHYTGGVYKQTSSVFKGNHAILIVGYDDNLGCWICKNSWGTAWGENGWFKIAYGECQIDTGFAAYDIDLKCPIPVVECDVTYLKKVLQAASRNASLKSALCYYVCGPRKGKPIPITPTNAAIVRKVIAILKVCPKYRLPFCKVLNCDLEL
jgi:C1A family cysteine protease